VIDAIKRLRNRDGSPTKSVGQVRLGPGNPPAAKEDDLALVAGSQTFRLLHACSVASGWSDRRVGLAPTGTAPPCHGAHVKQTFGITGVGQVNLSPSEKPEA